MALTNERLRELWFQRWPVMKGGRGSGHYGHAGRPGKHGGSAPGGARLGLAVTDSQHKALAAGEKVTIYNKKDGRITLEKSGKVYRAHIVVHAVPGKEGEIRVGRGSLAGALAAADDYFTKTAATQRRGA